jgi:hypothetical protein
MSPPVPAPVLPVRPLWDRSLFCLPLSTMFPRTSQPPAASSSLPSSLPASILQGGSPLSDLPPLGVLPPLSPRALEPEPLPDVPCQLCLKEAMRLGRECVYVRDASYRKCKRCSPEKSMTESTTSSTCRIGYRMTDWYIQPSGTSEGNPPCSRNGLEMSPGIENRDWESHYTDC